MQCKQTDNLWNRYLLDSMIKTSEIFLNWVTMYLVGFVVYCLLCSWSAGDPALLNSSSDATEVPRSLFSGEEKAFDHRSTDTLSTINPEHTTSEALVSANFKSDKELVSTQSSVVVGIADIIRFQQLVRYCLAKYRSRLKFISYHHHLVTILLIFLLLMLSLWLHWNIIIFHAELALVD